MIKKFDIIDSQQFLLTLYKEKQKHKLNLDNKLEPMLFHAMLLFTLQNDVKDFSPKELVDSALTSTATETFNFVCENLQNDPTYITPVENLDYKAAKGLRFLSNNVKSATKKALAYYRAKRAYFVKALKAPIDNNQLEEITLSFAETNDEMLAIQTALDASRKQLMIEKPCWFSKNKNQNATLEQTTTSNAETTTDTTTKT